MTQLIIPYLSQFYPLLIGITIFAILKSLNLLKHKTRVDLDTPIEREENGSDEITSLTEVAYIKDLQEDSDTAYPFYRYAYFGMSRFGNYITSSAEPRKSALSNMVNDRLIINGMQLRRVSESDAYEAAAKKFGIIDLYSCNSLPERIKDHKKLELAFPDNASFLNKILGREELSGSLLILAAGYDISMVS
ncbi:MAG: hypothetical protein M1520_01970 [Candidatus Marsarchaeota archaeon]|jgi:hypothetical protein|nr:hypothetical protein [Candidatus Marsarchaeota archaeon]